jgi:hypothetical protein
MTALPRGDDPPIPPAPPRGGKGETNDRAAYLAEVIRLLWPPPASARPVRGPGGSLIVLPSLSDPRLLVPAGRRAGAGAVRRYGEPGSARARISSRALELVLASGAGRLLLRDRLAVQVPPGAPAIETYLAAQLGHEVRLSLHLGAARANRKPVLQVLTPAGRTVAFAKLGSTPLTSALVQQERTALDTVNAAGLTTVTTPAVHRLGRWQDLDVLILTALPVWHPRRELAAGQLDAAMTEVAALAGRVTEPLASGSYLRQLTERTDGLPDSADRRALRATLAQLGDEQVPLRLGAWHGDWTPWNMACTRDGILLWDWERFGTGVPAGFDALHYWLQSAVVTRRAEPVAAATECVARAHQLLAPFGADPAVARLTARLYLCELSARYLADQQARAGARLGAPGTWLIPALAATTDDRVSS